MKNEKMIAIEILNEFEHILNDRNVSIPDIDREENEETEARIYGQTYYELEDNVTERIKMVKDDLLQIVTNCDNKETIIKEIKNYFEQEV